MIADQLRQLPGYDVYCLTEVLRRSFPIYKAALPDYQAIESTSGRSDRMMILFNLEKFELLERRELYQLNNGTHRSPFYVRLRDKKTRTELIVMTNHLARGNKYLRQQQAAGLLESLISATSIWTIPSNVRGGMRPSLKCCGTIFGSGFLQSPWLIHSGVTTTVRTDTHIRCWISLLYLGLPSDGIRSVV